MAEPGDEPGKERDRLIMQAVEGKEGKQGVETEEAAEAQGLALPWEGLLAYLHDLTLLAQGQQAAAKQQGRHAELGPFRQGGDTGRGA